MPIALAAGGATDRPGGHHLLRCRRFSASRRSAPSPTCASASRRKVMRLPVRYFDSTQTGVLLSRIMSDAEGIRNLVGTGLVQLVGGVRHRGDRPRRAALSQLAADLVTAIVLALFGGGMAYAFQTAAAAVPRARQDQRRGDGPAHRSARRHPHRQELHGREARRDRRSPRARTGCSATSPSR